MAGALRLVGNQCAKQIFLSAAPPLSIQSATLISVNNVLMSLPPRQAPFPFRYNELSMLLDDTTIRMNANSILAVVDGPIGAGKTAMAKAFAKEFDLKFFKDVDYNSLYVNKEDNFDLRTYNKYFDRVLFNDLDTFFSTENPLTNRLVSRTQFDMCLRRWHRYIEIKRYFLNSGHGSITTRSIWSDLPFAYALRKKRFMSPRVFQAYMRCYQMLTDALFQPHLIIYLDGTPEFCMDQIKKRGRPYEVNSPVLDLDFLKYLEEGYNRFLLDPLEEGSNFIKIDPARIPTRDKATWEYFVEEVEEMDIAPFHQSWMKDEKCKDWRIVQERHWSMIRLFLDDEKEQSELISEIHDIMMAEPELSNTAPEDEKLSILYNNEDWYKTAPSSYRNLPMKRL